MHAIPVKNVACGLTRLPLLEAVRRAFLFREPEGASVNWLSLFCVFVFSKPIPTRRLLLVFPEILWLRRICVGMVCEPTSRRSNFCFAFCTARRRNVNLKYSVTCVVPLNTAVWVHRRPTFTKTPLWLLPWAGARWKWWLYDGTAQRAGSKPAAIRSVRASKTVNVVTDENEMSGWQGGGGQDVSRIPWGN
jgi:hypothetical protein